MPITISVDSPQEPTQVQPNQPQVKPPPAKSNIKMDMVIRKALDGKIMISDHKNIDIVIDPEKMKVTSYAKGDFSDHVYAAQNRFFEFLTKKGTIDPGTIKGSNVYGSIEAKILKPEGDLLVDQIVILLVGKWLEEEKPALEMDKKYEEYFTQSLTDPDDEDSTELGEVSQEKIKGDMPNNIDNTRRYNGY